MPGTRQRRVLRRLGFVPVPRAMLPKVITLNVRPRGADAAPWLAPSSWYLTWGDGFVL
jgi:hypothetical protein